ncbi:hypothetical protein HOD29_04905 [archaeon]|jgi:hypothetical protein|nr:hypothetical protein [archaeon]
METISLSELGVKVDRLTNLVKNFINDDCILSEEDRIDIRQSWKEYYEGKTISGNQLKKELGYAG